jgi:Fic family protein
MKPVFTITNKVAEALTRVERARGFLEAAKLSEDWIRDMGQRALIREAYATTHIEGSNLTLEQSERLLTGHGVPEADPDDARELLNYRQAFDFVAEYVAGGGPLSEGLIREIHKRLVEGVRGGSAAPGEYRKVQNYDRDRATFYKAIQSVRANGMDMTGWVEFYTEGLAQQMREVTEKGERVIRRDVLVRKHGLNERQAALVEHLLAHGEIRLRDYEQLRPDVNRRTLQRDLKDLLTKGLVVEIGAGPTDPTRGYKWLSSGACKL